MRTTPGTESLESKKEEEPEKKGDVTGRDGSGEERDSLEKGRPEGDYHFKEGEAHIGESEQSARKLDRNEILHYLYALSKHFTERTRNSTKVSFALLGLTFSMVALFLAGHIELKADAVYVAVVISLITVIFGMVIAFLEEKIRPKLETIKARGDEGVVRKIMSLMARASLDTIALLFLLGFTLFGISSILGLVFFTDWGLPEMLMISISGTLITSFISVSLKRIYGKSYVEEIDKIICRMIFCDKKVDLEMVVTGLRKKGYIYSKKELLREFPCKVPCEELGSR